MISKSSLVAGVLRSSQHLAKKSTMTSLVPPVSVRGMTRLDRDSFASTILLPCLKLGSAKLSDLTPILKKYILKLKKLKPMKTEEDRTVVYLDPTKVRSTSDLEPADAEILLRYADKVERTSVTLTYENWQSEEILRAIMPEDVEVPTSFSKVGHIVHVNLRDSQLPYKRLIGEVLLDNVSQARTVVNKLSTIDTTYRHFSMEILAGENDTVATVKENGFAYKFDFAKVYWNPRLATEHARLITFMRAGDVLYDVFAGVGPFAVPAARKGVRVLANDLNPESYRWLVRNVAANKAKNVQAFNKDGRDFLREDVKKDILARRENKSSGREHVAMNLPALAYEFLDVLSGWFDADGARVLCENSPILHLYCFVKTEKDDCPKELARKLVEEKIGCCLSGECLRAVDHVRNVAPNKEMMRVSFALTENMIRTEEPARKRPKIEALAETLIVDDVPGQDGKEPEKRQDQERI